MEVPVEQQGKGQATAVPEAQDKERRNVLEGRQRQVLLVTPDTNFKEMVERSLENDSTVKLHYAVNPAEGLKIMRFLLYFDMIILEENTDLNSSLFINFWINHQVAQKSPIILVTDNADHKKLSDCRKLGIRLVLVQPVAFDDLFSKLKHFDIISINADADTLARFREVSFFEHFGDRSLKAVIEQDYIRRSSANIVNIREGRELKKLSIILSGRISIHSVRNPEFPLKVMELGPGRMLGESGMLKERTSPFRVRTEEECQFFNLLYTSFSALHPLIREKVYRSMIREMAMKEQELIDRAGL